MPRQHLAGRLREVVPATGVGAMDDSAYREPIRIVWWNRRVCIWPKHGGRIQPIGVHRPARWGEARRRGCHAVTGRAARFPGPPMLLRSWQSSRRRSQPGAPSRPPESALAARRAAQQGMWVQHPVDPETASSNPRNRKQPRGRRSRIPTPRSGRRAGTTAPAVPADRAGSAVRLAALAWLLGVSETTGEELLCDAPSPVRRRDHEG